MTLDELINKLTEIRSRYGNMEICGFCNAVAWNMDWAKITNVWVRKGNEEEMISDIAVIDFDEE